MSDSNSRGDQASAVQQQPTRVRYVIIASATLMAFLLYLDRFCVSFTVDYMRQDLGLTQNQISWFISAFFWSYALAQVPSGWLSDRHGARIMLVVYILSWSFFTAMIGAATSFAMLLLMRLGLGVGQAGAYPTAASVVARWVPIADRGLASAVVANGGRIGGAMAPVLTAYLLVFCTPADTPLTLNESDLLNPGRIVRRLTDPDDLSYLQAHMSSTQHGQLLRLRSDLPETAPAEAEAIAESQVEPLVEVLNGLIDSPGLYNREQMPSINLPRQGLKLLKRYERQETLTDFERLQLNRFVLEGVLPREVGRYYRHGWRPILLIYGAAGLLVAALFWYAFRERPDVHPWSNQAEYDLVMQGRSQVAHQHDRKLGAAPVGRLILSFNMWCCCFMQWGTNVGWLFIMTWLPRYLLDVHNVPIIERGYMTMTPPLIGIVGMFLGGRMTDVLAVRLGVRWGRRLPIVSSRLVAVLAYLVCIGVSQLPSGHTLNSAWVFTMLFAVVAFSTDFGAAPTWAFNQDIGGRHVGSVLGWGNMWGNLGAALAPPIYDHFLGENPTLANWNTMFGVCAIAFGISAVCGLLIDSNRPIVGEHE